MKTLLLLLIAALSGTAVPAMAQGAGDMARLEVLAGWRTDRGTHIAAIRVQLAPGWKTYWRAPGDAGIPAQFDWSGSDNLARVAVHWPVPTVFTLNGLTSVGYRDQVVIPLELTPYRAGQPISLAGRIDLGVCEEICVPLSVRVAATLPGGDAGRDARIAAALADRPMTPREAGLGTVRCTVTPAGGGVSLTADLALPSLGGDEFTVFELQGSEAWISQAETRRIGGTLSARADVVPAPGQPLTLDRSRLRITVLGRDGALDVTGCS